jgi:hypothetical protein
VTLDISSASYTYETLARPGWPITAAVQNSAGSTQQGNYTITLSVDDALIDAASGSGYATTTRRGSHVRRSVCRYR